MHFDILKLTLFFGSFRLNISDLYLFLYLLSVLMHRLNISFSMANASLATSLSVMFRSSLSLTLQKSDGQQQKQSTLFTSKSQSFFLKGSPYLEAHIFDFLEIAVEKQNYNPQNFLDLHNDGIIILNYYIKLKPR